MPTTYEPANTTPVNTVGKSELFTFPYPKEVNRLHNYDFYEQLFFGQHYTAFNVKIDSELYGKEYAKIRYIVANFAGLISKVVADLLFIEPPKIKVPDGDQEFLDALIRENKMRIVNYESALANSYFGDNLYKVRTGLKTPVDKEKSLFIGECSPRLYFPTLNPDDIKADPYEKELAWIVQSGDKKYLRKEIHYPGKIVNRAYLMEGNEIKAEVELGSIGVNIEPEIDTKIDRSLLIHVPNWRAGARYFGTSDYFDLETLFYAMNNRLSKIDNILDTHSDPILALPDGVVDEDGKVRKSKLRLFVRPKDGDKEDDPAYITWDANLEYAFKEIDKLVEMAFMISETSPDILGMGQGQAESGRALKLKLLRTLAKAQRKQLYYTEGLKESLYVAQLVAKAWGVKIDGKALTKDPVVPEIEWRDGLPADVTEMVETEAARLDAGITTTWEAIARVDDVDEDIAKKKAKEIKDEQKLEVEAMQIDKDTEKFGKGVSAT